MLAAGLFGGAVVLAVFSAGPGRAQGGGHSDAERGGDSSQLSMELIDPKVFRTCSDPHNMPYSTQNRDGFENKIAAFLADKLGKSVDFDWYPDSIGFIRNTLGSYKCDVIMGMPQGNDIVQVTNPYYRTAYTLMFKPGSGLDGADTLEDPRLKGKRIGLVAGTPPSTNIALNGLMTSVKPYPLVIDTRVDSSAAAMVQDLAKGEIDAGVLWGPLAGYYVKQTGLNATVVPLVKEKSGPSLVYYIGMGVRPADQEWKRLLNRLIGDNKPAMDRTILSYGVPLLDDQGHLMTEASLSKEP